MKKECLNSSYIKTYYICIYIYNIKRSNIIKNYLKQTLVFIKKTFVAVENSPIEAVNFTWGN